MPLNIAKNQLEQLLARGTLWTAHNSSEGSFQTGNQPIVPPGRIPLTAPFSSEIDSYLAEGGLGCGEIHEWSFRHVSEANYAQKKNWQAPVSIFLFLISNLLKASDKQSSLHSSQQRKLFFIGKRSWPTPHALNKYFGPGNSLSSSSKEIYNWRENCFFIDPPEKEQRLFSTVLALQSLSSLAVISDISFSNLTDSRRMKLAAKKSGALGLLFRSPWETLSSKLSASAASTRWTLGAQPEGWRLGLGYAKSCNVPMEWKLQPEFSISSENKNEESPANNPKQGLSYLRENN